MSVPDIPPPKDPQPTWKPWTILVHQDPKVTDQHLVPQQDTFQHIGVYQCPCQPKLKIIRNPGEPTRFFFVHNPHDMRDIEEALFFNVFYPDQDPSDFFGGIDPSKPNPTDPNNPNFQPV